MRQPITDRQTDRRTWVTLSDKPGVQHLKLFDITDNKYFWETMKPFLSNKVAFSHKISLKIVSNDTEISNIPDKSSVEAVH